MANSTATKLETPHPPLAHDPHGNCVPIPDGTSALELCRETTGRPRKIKGTDQQPVRFPLTTTPDDVVEMCGADVYRVYALNEVGTPLDYITTWNLTREARELRNASTVEASALAPLRPSSTYAAPTTDVRFVLEAMTQMMRTNSDALRLVTDSHVDLAKVLASAKGMPRNLAALALPPIALENDDTEDEEDEEDDATAQPNKSDRLVEFGLGVITLVNNLMTQFTTPKGNRSSSSTPSKGFDLRSVLDWRHAAKQAQIPREGTDGSDARLSEVSDLASLVKSLPIEVMSKLMQVRQKLEPDEEARAMELVMNIPKADLPAVIDELKSRSIDEIVALFRDQLAKLAQERGTP